MNLQRNESAYIVCSLLQWEPSLLTASGTLLDFKDNCFFKPSFTFCRHCVWVLAIICLCFLTIVASNSFRKRTRKCRKCVCSWRMGYDRLGFGKAWGTLRVEEILLGYFYIGLMIPFCGIRCSFSPSTYCCTRCYFRMQDKPVVSDAVRECTVPLKRWYPMLDYPIVRQFTALGNNI